MARVLVVANPVGSAMSDVRFDGRVAIITGAGRGIGREFALLLAERGAAVVVNDIGSAADARRYASDPTDGVASEVVELITERGGRAVSNTADIADAQGAASLAALALEAFGRVDILINNAGIVLVDTFADLSVETLDACYRVHVRGSFQVAKAVWPHMTAAGYGRILNVCSVDGVLFGNPLHAAYDAAKGGLAGLTRGMSADGAPLGILVNGLLPGALTRGNQSVSHAYGPLPIDMSPALVAPAAAWLVHEECVVNGRFFASSAARMGEVFTATAEGVQAIPDEFSPEFVREHWDAIQQRSPFLVPDGVRDFNAWRTRVFQSVVGLAVDSQASRDPRVSRRC
jgi:NAD(P)-dependent dehydrogenase (short-subunit alcohol dehydrogenase family)